MPLSKILLKPGINRENTRYTTEGGWYDGDKVRFRQGTPEKIGGWRRISSNTFQGVCRSLWNWVTLAGRNLIGVGTNTGFFIEQGGVYTDITPIRTALTINADPFALTASTTVTVTDTAHGCTSGALVIFSGAVAIGGAGTNVTAEVLNTQFQVTVTSEDTYTITIAVVPNATALAGSPGGGAAVVATYLLNPGPEAEVPLVGWGGNAWGIGSWGFGRPTSIPLRLWSQSNFGEDLLLCPRGGALYYWDTSAGTTALNRGQNIALMMGASDVPTLVNQVLVSDISRFVFAFGATDIGSATLDPLLVRWSDQEDYLNWTPSATTQAGGLRLSLGSSIVTALQSRQEVLVWTDTAVYSLQYLGPPFVWGAQIVGENISIIGPNATTIASGVTYWMGLDKFYKYDGRTQTLRCDLRQYVFDDINLLQSQQVCCGTNEGFNEIWWFYCSASSTQIDKYVVYNYAEDIWYYGTMGRTAWLDSGLQSGPIAATYARNLVNHETGNDDGIGSSLVPIESFISSAEFDLGDGYNFSFVWRVLPDITFRGSTSAPTAPNVTMTLLALRSSGSGITNSTSLTGPNSANIVRTSTFPVEEFTGQVFPRVRGRQMILRVESNDLGVAWQMGAFRLDLRPDGRR